HYSLRSTKANGPGRSPIRTPSRRRLSLSPARRSDATNQLSNGECMAEIVYTHAHSLVCGCLNIIVNFIGALMIPAILSDAFGLNIYLALVGGFVVMIGMNRLFLSQFFRTLSAYMYIRLDLDTKVSYREAEGLAFLFIPNETGVWWPMREVKSLPEKERKQYIYAYLTRIVRSIENPNAPEAFRPPRIVDDYYINCPSCGFEQWGGYSTCQKCGTAFQ